MSSMTLSIMGIERYITGMGNDSLFKNITIPEDINKDLLVNTILEDSAHFEALYTNPDYLRDSITNWFNRYLYTFDKWVKALAIEYNPLSNYDRHEEYTDSEGTITTGHDTMTSTSTSNDSVNGTVTDKVVPYEDGILTNKGQTENVSTNNVSTTGNTATDTSTNNNRTLTHTAHLYGNIGVTSSQEMLQNELEIAKFNIIKQISDLFVSDYCLMIY